MQIEKAIERMKSYKKMHSDDYFDMAIDVLEKLKDGKLVESIPCNDCVSCSGCISIIKDGYRANYGLCSTTKNKQTT